MGQKVLGVFYGCVVPDGLNLYDEGSDDPLLGKWEKVKAHRKLGLTTSVGDKHLIGFWVALGGDNPGTWDISKKCLPLTVIEKTKEAKQAMAYWKKFTAWAKANGVNFIAPTFWLAPAEVA